ncbi:hypothetical protein E4T56_gene11711 [Termitomyces sp. T112]|nr:hypothetical protein E4T56_gene11711 [Termitomyces sp. T112]
MSVSSSQPNYAQIILPPGLTLDQYYDLQGKSVTIAIAVACAVALVVWDFFNLLPTELILYREMDKRNWSAPGTWAFIILRYSSLLALIPGLWFTSLQNQHCQVAASLGEVGVVLVLGSSGVIFCYRVFSIWKFRKVVIILVSLMYIVMLGCWIAVATQLRATEGPHTAFGSNCQLHPVPNWSPIGLASSVAFDSTILLLTLSGLARSGQTNSLITRRLLRDNLLYFIIVSLTNLVVLVIQSLGHKFEFVKPLALPYPTLMTAAMGSRVFLNLRLFEYHRSKEHISGGIPLASGSTTLPFPSNPGLAFYELGEAKQTATRIRIDRTTNVMENISPGTLKMGEQA